MKWLQYVSRVALVAGFAAALSPAVPLAAEDDFLVEPAGAVFPCPHCQGCPHDEIVYQDVVCHRCVLKPDRKEIKKTVYDCKEVPFCLHKLPPLFSHWHKKGCCETCGNDCRECACPRYKKVLLKKEVVCGEICTSKCVIEEYTERVPVRVCRACPHCARGNAGCALPTPSCAEVAPPAVPLDDRSAGLPRVTPLGDVPLGPVTRSLSDDPSFPVPTAPLIPAPPVPAPEF
jgi:hypothetical protein